MSNAPWFLPFLDFIETTSPISLFHVTHSYLEPVRTYLFQSLVFNQYMNIPFQKSAMIDTLFMVLGICGMLGWWKHGQRMRAIVFGATVAFLFLLSYYGSFFRWTASLTPLRFLIVMNIYLAFTAAAGISGLYRSFLSDKKALSRRAVTVLAACLLATFFVTPYNHLYIKRDYQLLTQIPPQLQGLVDWIRESTTQEGRILVENSGFESDHQYYGTHLPYLFPYLTQREYLGNYSIYTPTRDTFSSFYNSQLFLKPISEYSPDEAMAYLNLYNIQWIICWSPEAKAFFKGLPSRFFAEEEIGRFSVYQVQRSPTFFIKGSGSAKAELNQIELKDIVADSGQVVVSYHWMKYLKTDPPTAIEPVFLLEDPVGFIRLRNPPEKVVIYNSYKG
jgi:hypothetical protein